MAHLVPAVPKSQARTIPSLQQRSRRRSSSLQVEAETTHNNPKATMSVRPGLIAASRVGAPSKALRTQWIRCASDSANSPAPPKRTATVQDADKEIKERQRMMRRLPPGFGAYAPIVFGKAISRPRLTVQSPSLIRHGSSRTSSSTSRSTCGSA